MYAVFIGHQRDGIGGGFDLFNVVDPSPCKNILDGSTVSIKTILKLKIKDIRYKDGRKYVAGLSEIKAR